MKNIAKYLSERLDILGAMAGCLMGAVMAYAGYLTYRQDTVDMGGAILVSSIIYLLLRRLAKPVDISFSQNTSLILFLNIVFISCLAASLLVVHNSVYRPPLYFVLISICATTVAVEILFSEGNSKTWVFLLKILLIAANIRVSLYYEYPGFYGTDVWFHAADVEYWINTGHISYYIPTTRSENSYFSMAVIHLHIMVTKIITSLSTRDSMFISIGVFHLTTILFIFLLVQRILGNKGGLLAALLASVSQLHISSAVFLAPTSLGVALYTVILFLLFRKTPNVWNTFFIIILSVTLIFSHTVSAFIASVALVFLVISNEVYRRLDKGNTKEMSIGYNLAIMFVIMMVSHWMYMFYSTARTLFATLLQPFVNALQTDMEFTGLSYRTAETSLNRIGFLMLMGLIVIGALYWFSQKARNNLKTDIIILAFVLSVIAFIFPVLNILSLVTSRWLPFIFVTGVAIATQGITSLSGIVKGRVSQAVLIAIIVFAFSLFNTNNALVNLHSPFASVPSRYPYTQSELDSFATILKNYEGNIVSDRLIINEYLQTTQYSRIGGYLDLLPWAEARNWPEAQARYLKEPFLPQFGTDAPVIIRNYLYLHPELLRGTESDFLNEFQGSRYNLIYQNSEVKAYLPRR